MGITYVVTDNAINLTIDGRMEVLHKTHTNYSKVVELLKNNGDVEEIKNLMNPAKKVKEFGEGYLKVKDGVIIYTGQGKDIEVTVDNSLIFRIEAMIDGNFNVKPLILFFENLMLNPSSHSVQGLYSFLEKNELPITDDGHFLAYKKIRHDYMDIKTHTFDNHPGKICEMLRNQVDDDKRNTCSRGLHFASFHYASKEYSSNDTDDRLVIVKINPKDVVAFPDDYNGAKGRCCRYEVIQEVPNDGMEYLLKNFQGIKTVDQVRDIIKDIRDIALQFTPTDLKIDYKLNTVFADAGLHKERIRSIITAVANKYNIDLDVANKLDTSVTSIYKLISFVTKEHDFSA